MITQRLAVALLIFSPLLLLSFRFLGSAPSATIGVAPLQSAVNHSSCCSMVVAPTGGAWTPSGDYSDPACIDRPSLHHLLSSSNLITSSSGTTSSPQHQRWLWMGTSHLRYLMNQMIRLLGGTRTRLVTSRHSNATVSLPRYHLTFVWIWATGIDKPFHVPSAFYGENGSKTFDRILFSHGFWQMMFRDVPEYPELLRRDLAYLRGLQQPHSVPVTFLALHRAYPSHVPTHNYCATDRRVRHYREVMACVIEGEGGNVETLDVYPLTDTPKAQWYVMSDGHHYVVGSPVMV